jgi:hypothetical protein
VANIVGTEPGQGIPDIVVGSWLFGTHAPVTTDCAPVPTTGGPSMPQGDMKSGAFYVVNGKSGTLRYRIIGEAEKDHLGRDVAAGIFGSSGQISIFSGGFGHSNPALFPVTETGRIYRFEANLLTQVP